MGLPKKTLEDALTLSSADRAELVDHLLASHDRPDPEMDALWTREAEDRIDAFDAGELESIPAREVMDWYLKQ